ncbi:MAG: cobalamin-dependent protein [Phycisphaerae bacterium]
MNHPIRVLIAKIGLDGHDRGAKLIVRNLRDAGMEVIYTGLWQTPAATVHAAMQEDVDVLGVSLLSAAHMTIMPELVRLCRSYGLQHTGLVVGGIIPEQDKQPLIDAGVHGVFTPGTSMATVIVSIRKLGETRRTRVQSGGAPPDIRTPSGLARAITAIVQQRHDSTPSSAGAGGVCIGVTGAPGVGKSTFIGRLAKNLRARGKRVAVIAVDPTSPLTGGSVLGDRLRMMSAEPDEGLFVRSLSSADAPGGLAPHTREIATLLSAAGYEVVLIETVGAGQNDVEIRNVAQRVLLVLMPGSGDEVQFAKAGVVEIASGFVVNKSDLAGADITIRELRNTLDDDRPIWTVSALRGEGLDEVCEWVCVR